jgi:hypothetical protein
MYPPFPESRLTNPIRVPEQRRMRYVYSKHKLCLSSLRRSNSLIFICLIPTRILEQRRMRYVYNRQKFWLHQSAWSKSLLYSIPIKLLHDQGCDGELSFSHSVACCLLSIRSTYDCRFSFSHWDHPYPPLYSSYWDGQTVKPVNTGSTILLCTQAN